LARKFNFVELIEAKQEIQKGLQLQEELHQVKAQALVGKMAKKVYHNMQPPLEALKAALPDMKLSEFLRRLVGNAISRITDISNDLMLVRMQAENILASGSEVVERSKTRPALLSSLVQLIVSEQRMRHRSKHGIIIQEEIEPRSYGTFINVQPSKFQSVLANLINNAAEALEDNGVIRVSVEIGADDVEIAIQDTGCGMNEEQVKVAEEGLSTSTKPNGTGIGLPDAVETIKVWGGTLKLTSKVNEGTTVKIALPKTPCPLWFVQEIHVKVGTTIVILDDDLTFHDVWNQRLKHLELEKDNIKIRHFSNGDDFVNWYHGATEEIVSDALYLIDYELTDETKTGVNIIQDLKIEKQSVLVTSYFDEKETDAPGIRRMPKAMVSSVPVIILERENIDRVFIDDQDAAHDIWKLGSSRDKRKIKYFFDPQHFVRQGHLFSMETPIYVDKDLSNDVCGFDVARNLHDMGFRELIITTADVDLIKIKPDYVKAIIGKAYPVGSA
jgi:nitrogen-specific signal transduction histidine kinase